MTLPQVTPLAVEQYTWAARHLLKGFEYIRDINAGRGVGNDPRTLREKTSDAFVIEKVDKEYARCLEAADIILTHSLNVVGPVRFDQLVTRLDAIKKAPASNLNPLRDIVNAFKALGLLPAGMVALQQGYQDFAVGILNSENPVDHRLMRYVGASQYLTHMMRGVALEGEYLLLRGAWIAFPTWVDTVRDQLNPQEAAIVENIWGQILDAQDHYDPTVPDQSLHSLRGTLASSTQGTGDQSAQNFLYAGLKPMIRRGLLDAIGTHWSLAQSRYQPIANEVRQPTYLRRRFAEDPSIKGDPHFEQYEKAMTFFDVRRGLLTTDENGANELQRTLATYQNALIEACKARNSKIHVDYDKYLNQFRVTIEEELNKGTLQVNTTLNFLLNICRTVGLVFDPQTETWEEFITKLSQPRPELS